MGVGGGGGGSGSGASSIEGENAGLWSEIECESGVSGTDRIGRVWLAFWPAAHPGALPERSGWLQ